MRFFAVALIGALLSFMLAAPAPANAEDIPPPTGEVILTVTGNIGVRNVEDRAEFDLALLRRLPGTEFSTTTIWTDGVGRFKGVSLAALLKAVGATGENLTAVALNDYQISIPVSDAVEGGPIVAYELDGREMSVREKGPLWIMYPFDDDPSYRRETIYTRCIWQLARLTVVD